MRRFQRLAQGDTQTGKSGLQPHLSRDDEADMRAGIARSKYLLTIAKFEEMKRQFLDQLGDFLGGNTLKKWQLHQLLIHAVHVLSSASD